MLNFIVFYELFLFDASLLVICRLTKNSVTQLIYIYPLPPPVFFISLVYYKTFTITQSFLVHFRLANCQSITSSLNSPKRQNKTRKPIRKADKPGVPFL